MNSVVLERMGYTGQGSGTTPDKVSVHEGHGQPAVDILHPHQSPALMDFSHQHLKTSKSTQGLLFSDPPVCGSPTVARPLEQKTSASPTLDLTIVCGCGGGSYPWLRSEIC